MASGRSKAMLLMAVITVTTMTKEIEGKRKETFLESTVHMFSARRFLRRFFCMPVSCVFACRKLSVISRPLEIRGKVRVSRGEGEDEILGREAEMGICKFSPRQAQKPQQQREGP